MTTETAILRAYALASEEKFEEAEALLKSSPGALNEPSGIDLLARIRREQGDLEGARRLWESVLRLAPDYIDAQAALESLMNPLPLEEDPDRVWGRKSLLLISGLVLTLLVVILALLCRACRTSESVSSPICVTNFVDRIKRIEVPVTNTVKEVKVITKVITNEVKTVDIRTVIVTNEVPVVEYRDRVVTNDTERTIYRNGAFARTNVKTNGVIDLPPINWRRETSYVVREGETVSALMKRYHFTLRDFTTVNPEVNPDRIYAGQSVNLPGDINVEEE